MIKGFDNEKFAGWIESLRDPDRNRVLEKNVQKRSGVGQRTIYDFKRNSINDENKFRIRLSRIVDAANELCAPLSLWAVEDFYQQTALSPERVRFEWLGLPDEQRPLWKSWGKAYNTIFDYQNDRDDIESFKAWAEKSEQSRCNILQDWPYRSVQCGAFIGNNCCAIFHATISLRHAFGLLTYAGVLDPPTYESRLFYNLRAEAASKCEIVEGKRIDYVFEIDQPDSITWRLVVDGDVAELRKHARMVSRRSRFVESVRRIKRARSLVDSKTLMLCNGDGSFFDYVQPDMRENGAGDGRKMWVGIRSKSGSTKRKPQRVLEFLYDTIYGKFYEEILGSKNPYWAKLGKLRAVKIEAAMSACLISDCQAFNDAKRLFIGDEILRRIWCDIDLRNH